MDRLFRSPGVFRGHVVDFLQLPYWPIFNVADMCITAAAVMIMVLAVVKNVGVDGKRAGLVPDLKVVLVPDGLNGERVDAAIARMLGLSRSRSTDLIAARPGSAGRWPGGQVRPGAFRSDARGRARGSAGGPAVVPHLVPGVRIVHDDDDIVVVDKPVGVAAHPSLGWDGPDVLSHLAGAGFRISTSGVPERRGIVQRLDVGTSGLMVVAKSEIAYTILKRAFRSRSVEKTYHALVQGHPDPFTGTIDAPIGRHPGADYKMAVIAGGRPSVTHYDTAGGLRRGDAADDQAGDRPHPPDPGAHGGDPASVRRRPDYGGRPGAGRPAGPGPAVAARRWPAVHPSDVRGGDELHLALSGRPGARAGASSGAW